MMSFLYFDTEVSLEKNIPAGETSGNTLLTSSQLLHLGRSLKQFLFECHFLNQ